MTRYQQLSFPLNWQQTKHITHWYFKGKRGRKRERRQKGEEEGRMKREVRQFLESREHSTHVSIQTSTHPQRTRAAVHEATGQKENE